MSDVPPPPPPPPSGLDAVAVKPGPVGWFLRLSNGKKVALILGVLVLGIMLMPAPDEPPVQSDAAPDTTAAAGADDSTPDTSAPPRTTERPAPTTTVVATTTTSAPTPEELAALNNMTFVLVCEQSRDGFIDALTNDMNVQSVDQWLCREDGVMEVSITSAWATPENQADGAWELMRAFAVIWDDDDGLFNTDFKPPLRFVNSDTVYECSGDFMDRLADTRASRADWEAEC